MKRIKSLLTAIIFGLSVLFAGLPAFLLPSRTAALASDIQEISTKMPDFSITNADFGKNSPTTGEPMTPSDWTGAYGKNLSGQSVKSGLVNLTNAETSKKDWGLENVEIPSIGSDKGDLSKALLINSGSQKTVYTYTSASFTIAPNSFLHVSFQAHAALAEGQAFARLSTSELDSAVLPVVSNKDNDDGWTTYHIFVKSHTYKSITSSLVFSLGTDQDIEDANGDTVENVRPAKGHLFVRDIQTMLLTPETYQDYEASESGNACAVFSEADVFASQKLSSDIEEHNPDMWKSDSNSFKSINTVGYGTTVNNVKLPSPGSPFSADNNVLAATGTTEKPTTDTLTTKDENDLTVPRFGYVRLSIWVNTAALTGGTVTFTATKGVSDDEDKVIDETEETTSVTSFTAQNKDSWTGNWSEAVIYIKGSAFDNTTIKIGLSVSSLVGEVYFDALTYSFTDGTDYSEKPSEAQKLEMAVSPVADSIPNGNFNLVGTSKKDDVLLPALNWSTDLTALAAAGIVGLDDAYYNDPDFASKRAEIKLTEKPAIPAGGKTNAYVIWNREAAAGTVTSDSFSAPEVKDGDGNAVAKDYQRIVVTAANRTARTDAVKIQLLYDGKVIAERNDLDSAEFKDYEFNIKVDSAKTYKYTLAVSVGNKNNDDTYTTGGLWISKVYIGSADTPTTGIGVKTVDLSGDLFSAVKSDNLYADNYAWDKVFNTAEGTAMLGFVKTNGHQQNLAEIYTEMFKGAENDYGMLIHATEASSVGYQQVFPIVYTDSTYVKVSVRLKTRGFKQSEGATIRLGDKALFENVNTQFLKDSELTEDILTGGEYSLKENNYSGWREYAFYINVGAATSNPTDGEETDDITTESESKTKEAKKADSSTDGDTDDDTTVTAIETAIKILVGDSLSALRSGIVLVDRITVETIDENLYASSTAALDNKNEDLIPTNIQRVNLREVKADTAITGATSPNKTLSMNLMLTILGSVLAGILALMLLAMLIKGVVSRRRARVSGTSPSTVSYDRSNVERNYASGSGYVQQPQKSSDDDESEDDDETVIEAESAPANPKKQPKSVRQFKKQQRQKEAAKNYAHARKNRRGLSKQQDADFIEELKNPELPPDEIDDFD